MLKYLTFLMALSLTLTAVHADEFVFHHEQVLGTNLELRIDCESETTATRIEAAVLAETDRLASLLSNHDKQSEFSLWQSGLVGDTEQISSELQTVLSRAEHWRLSTGGAFDVRAAELDRLWQRVSAGVSTSADESRHRLVEKLAAAPYHVESNSATRLTSCRMSLDALAKGYVLDQVCNLVQDRFSVENFAINLGGDIRKIGDSTLPVSIADPENAHEGASPVATVQLMGDGAIATSGGYYRGQHIFDPRTGLPVEACASVTVMGANAMDADALATAISVLGGAKGVALVESLTKTECFVLAANGDVFQSSGWPQQEEEKEQQEAEQEKKSSADESKEKQGLVLKFKLNRPKGKRYRRPYVAAWLEDKDGFPVKTALLFLQTDNPGPRWHRDLTRWYRNDRTRKMVEKTDLIGTVSGATRGPGEYSAVFDGTDNVGEQLAKGAYTLCLEVAREHGTYQIIREKLDWDPAIAIPKKELESNIEVSSVSYAYKPEERNSGKPKTDASGDQEAAKTGISFN